MAGTAADKLVAPKAKKWEKSQKLLVNASGKKLHVS